MHLSTYCVHEVHASLAIPQVAEGFALFSLVKGQMFSRYTISALLVMRPSKCSQQQQQQQQQQSYLFYNDEPSRSPLFCAFRVILNLQPTHLSVCVHGVCHVQA